MDLSQLTKLSTDTLRKVVTPHGIYASTALGAEGMYHGFFGRDTAITAYLIAQAEHLHQQSFFLYDAVNGLNQLMKWQSRKDDPDTGEEYGKFAHEVRLNKEDYKHLTEGFSQQGKKSWYVDPQDQVLKNWDTSDATQLWIIVMARLHEKQMITMNKDLREALKSGLDWCLRNLKEFDGFAGYKYDEERKWAGLINHTWKDSSGSYMYEDGTPAQKPLKDVFVNALTWSALKYGASIFSTYDHHYSLELAKTANELKERFNDLDKGFLMHDPYSGFYYAEALDANNKKLTGISCDAALALWAYCGEESIIDNKYLSSVVKRIMRDDMFAPEAGVRTYSCQLKAYDPVPYHRGPHTFWPFVTALIADGITHFGYGYEAKQVLTSMVKAVQSFNSCIELFVKNGDKLERWKHPYADQVSCTDQAWTAAAVYYATKFLEANP